MKAFTQFALGAAIALGSISVGHAADMKMPVKALAPVAPIQWINAFAGVTVVPQSVYGEAGAVFALNHNLATDGFLFRIKGGGGGYSYNRTPVLKQNASFETGDIMLGYQKFVGATRLTLYAGANVENHDNTDPLATVRGTKVGAKVLGELYTEFNPSTYALVSGSYATDFRNYFTMAKLGFKILPNVSIGPEIAQLGNQRFDAFRAGPFVAFDLTQSAQFILSAGYYDDERKNALNNHSGAYGEVHLRSNF